MGYTVKRPRWVNRARESDWCLIRPKMTMVDNVLVAAPDVTEVWVYDEIGYWGTSASDFVAALGAISTSNIDLHINSPGGEVFDGIAIFELLKAHPAKVCTYVDGLAASIASVIAMAGDRIVMGRNAQMMIHEAAGGAWGSAGDLRSTADLLDRVSTNIADVYADRAGKTSAHWRNLMLAETWFFSSEAVTAGLADELSGPVKRDEPEPDSPMDQWDLSVFRYSNRAVAPPPLLRTPEAPMPPADPELDFQALSTLLKGAFL